MKHIHETQISVYQRALHEMGIDSESWEAITIILNTVSAYRIYVDKEGDINKDLTLVYCCCDDPFLIDTPYSEFHRIMKEYLQD